MLSFNRFSLVQRNVLCIQYSCSEDPDFYKEKTDCFHMRYNLFHKQNPFGTLLGYRTTEGVIAVPTVPVGGYVYCTEVRQWILYASQATDGKGSRRGGFPHFRKKG